MASHLIRHICAGKRDIKLKVRVVHLWKQPNFVNPSFGDSLEMVLLDEEGGKIQATVKNVHFKKYEKLVNEMHAYRVSNLTVALNGQNYKPCRHEFRLYFQYKTELEEIRESSIPMYGFSFTPFQDVLDMDRDNHILIDVVGVMTSISSIRVFNKNDVQTRNVVTELDDTRGTKLKCILWGEFADQMLQYVQDNSHGPYVIILQLAKMRRYMGEMEVSNTKYSSRLLINAEDPIVASFKIRFLEANPSSSNALTQLTSQGSYSVEDDFLRQTLPRNLDDLKDSKEPGKFVVLATIKHLVKRSRWFYNGCPSGKCTTSVEKNLDQQNWFCRTCAKDYDNMVEKFKIEIVVMDYTDSATFVLWNKESEKLLGMDAHDLLQRIKEQGFDPKEYPTELNNLLDKKLLFKVQVKVQNIENIEDENYHVQKVCIDDAIINSFIEMNNLKEDQSLISPSASINNETEVTVDSDMVGRLAFEAPMSVITPAKRSTPDSVEFGSVNRYDKHSSSKMLRPVKKEKASM